VQPIGPALAGLLVTMASSETREVIISNREGETSPGPTLRRRPDAPAVPEMALWPRCLRDSLQSVKVR
jgi:hypothetical protein